MTKKGLPSVSRVHRLHERLGWRRPGRHLDEALDVVLGQAAEEHALAQVLAVQLAQRLRERVLAPQLDVAVGAEHQQPAPAQLLREELQQQQRRLVRPVHVVEHDHQRRALGGVLEEGRDAVEEAEARLVRLELRRRREAGQPLLHLGDDLRDVGRAGPHLRGEFLRLLFVDVGADDLHPRPVGRRALAFVAAAPEHLHVAQARVGRELLRGARLADPRLADQHHQPAAARQGVLEARAELVHLLLAADEDAGRQAVQRVHVRVRRNRRRRRRRRTIACRASGIAAALSGRSFGSFASSRMISDSSAARHLRVVPGGRDRRGVDVLRDDRHGVVAEERRAAGHHFVRHAAQRVEVGAGVRLAAQRLLGRHVGDGADHHAFHRQAAAFEGHGEAEVADLGGAVLGQPDVAGLEVAMDDAALVRVRQTLLDLLRDADRLLYRQAAVWGFV